MKVFKQALFTKERPRPIEQRTLFCMRKQMFRG
jgi:hypothetical protein